jgi:hypothetical protein
MYVRALCTEICVYAYNQAVPLSTLTVAQLVKELLAFYYSVHSRPSNKGSRGNIEKIQKTNEYHSTCYLSSIFKIREVLRIEIRSEAAVIRLSG